MGALVVYYSPYVYELFSRETRKVSHWYFFRLSDGKSQNTNGDLGVGYPERMTVAVPALRSVYKAISLNPPSLNFL